MKRKKIINRVFALLLLLLMFLEFPAGVFAQENASSSSADDSSSISNPLEEISNISAVVTPTPQEDLSPNFSSPQNNDSAAVKMPTVVRSLNKKFFRANEKVSVRVENIYLSEVVVKVFREGKEVAVDVKEVPEGNARNITIEPPKELAPGKYTVEITDETGEKTTQDFSWGVLAINTDKSIYLPGEKVNFSMAVLDEVGMMVCNAKLNLEIRNPKSPSAPVRDLSPQALRAGEIRNLSTEDGTIKVNEECNLHGFTLVPDYEAEFVANLEGKYSLTLSAETKNGTSSITDAFNVRQTVPFDVKRETATRIFPPAKYPVNIEISANEDFDGVITEVVPYDFVVSEASGSAKSFDRETVVSQFDAEQDVLGVSDLSLSLPFDESFPISSGFGDELKDNLLKKLYRQFGLAGHDGVDFALLEATPVKTVDSGEVVLAEVKGDYGTTVVVRHEWGKSYYGHLSKINEKFTKSTVETPVKIEKGEVLGLSGSTGLSTAPHLHFGIKPNEFDFTNGYYGKINPLPYLGLEQKGDVATPVKVLSWKLNIKKGETVTIGYQFKAPDISPMFYTLGPLKFFNKGKMVFAEERQWQIAADAITIAGSRIFDSNRTAQAAEDTLVTNWTKTNVLVVSIGIQTAANDRCNSGDTYTVQWRNKTDAGAWTNLGGTGDLRTETTSVLVDANALTSAEHGITGTGTYIQNNTEEETGAGSFSARFENGDWAAVQFSVNPANAQDGKEYEFRLNVSCNSGSATPTGLATVTMAAAGPTNDQLMRHGKWFNSGAEQPFTF